MPLMWATVDRELENKHTNKQKNMILRRIKFTNRKQIMENQDNLHT